MSNPASSEVQPLHQTQQDVVAGASGVIVSTLAAIHEIKVIAPAVQCVPGIEHSSSYTASFVVATGTSALAETIAGRLEDAHRDTAALGVRKASTALAWLSSISTQLVIETNSWAGVSDKRDVIAGLVATAPGIIFGKALSHAIRQTKRQETS